MTVGGQIFRRAFWAAFLPLLLVACTTASPPPPPAPPPPPPPPREATVDPTPPGEGGSGSSGYSGTYSGSSGGAATPSAATPRRTVRRLVVQPSAPERAVSVESTPVRATTTPASAVSASRPILCAITKTRLSVSACDELTEQNALTQAGVDAAPTALRMQLKQSMTYTYSIGAQGSEATVRRNVTTSDTPVSTGTVAFGHFNYAKLSGGPGIKIEPLDSEVKDTIANPTPVWRWKLTALEPGAHQLTLDAGVELRAADTAPVRLGQNAKRIDVAVDVTGVNKIAQLASDTNTVLGISTDVLKKLAVFLGAVGAALAAFRALRGKTKADSAS